MSNLYETNGNTALQYDDSTFTCIEMHPISHHSKHGALKDMLVCAHEELVTGTARGTSSRSLSISDKVLAGLLGTASMAILCLCMMLPKLFG